MKLLWLVVLLSPIVIPRLWAAAEEKKSSPKKGPVVNMGSLEVEGEARQPNLQVIESSELRDKALEEVWAGEMQRIEAELLEPRRPAK